MSRYNYDRLTALDNSFLLLEGPNTPMHVASTAVYEAAPLAKPDGGIDADRIRQYVVSRLHKIPRYRQRLAWIPLESHAVWVDDEHFNIHYHVRHTALPRPGDERQLKRLSARIMSQRLDRSRPLWEMWVVEGFEGGERFAVINKTHHCMIDGVSGVDLLSILMTPEPTERIDDPPPYIPRPVPSRLDLFRDDLWRLAATPLEVARGLSGAIQELREERSEFQLRLRSILDMAGASLWNASDTPLNPPIGPHRRFDWLPMSLAEIKEVKNRLGGSLNDVVLACVAGAVRRFLERRQVSVRGIDFRVLAPVSMRVEEERGTLGNRVSGWSVPLPIAERDPKKRLEKIRQETERLKKSKQAMAAEALARVSEWTPSTLLSLGARLGSSVMRPFNMVVTNVPGPQVPLHLLGSKMVACYPMVPLWTNQGVGVALFSYEGRLHWGFNADWQLFPDLHDFVESVAASFAELRGVAPAVEVGRAPEVRPAAARA